MTGKIIKGIAGFYYVHVPGNGIYECKARGIFRKDSIKPLIGDDVVFEVLDEVEKKGNIDEIKPRKNSLIRPTVANIGQVMLVFAVSQPRPNLNLLDRFLIMVEREGIEAVICFNKVDTLGPQEIEAIQYIYEKIGYKVFLTSAEKSQGIAVLEQALRDTTTVFAGPSGVGKSSLLNLIQSEFNLETGAISEKVQRGKHTTRHAQLICFRENSYVVDTPGFSSLNLEDMDCGDLRHYFREFERYSDDCKFNGCHHINEPVCGVKKAVEAGEIPESRYKNYELIYQELKDIRRW